MIFKKDDRADLAVIGAGIVGCAIAENLASCHPDKKVIVFEKLPRPGLEASQFNSGVLHSGFHENPKFIKAQLARRGSKMAIEHLRKSGFRTLDCGMIIAVSRKELLANLLAGALPFCSLLKRGLENKIHYQFLTRFALKKLEPQLEALGGIYIPGVSVVDPGQFTDALFNRARQNGAAFFFNAEVKKMDLIGNSYRIVAGDNEFIADAVINSAGLYADEVAALAGFSGYRIFPWRGEYYEVVTEKRSLIRHLVYPVVGRRALSKGIHFSPRVDGRLFVGPNARPVPSKKYYTEDKTPVDVFCNAARLFYPQIKEEDLKWGYSGIRPKLTADSGSSDFGIFIDRKLPPFVNLIGIDSPGLSSAMAIAEYVAGLLDGWL